MGNYGSYPTDIREQVTELKARIETIEKELFIDENGNDMRDVCTKCKENFTKQARQEERKAIGEWLDDNLAWSHIEILREALQRGDKPEEIK